MPIRQGFTVEGGKDLDTSLAFAADHGFDFVELNMEGQFARSRVDPGRIRDCAESHGIDLVVHLPFSIDPASPHEEVRRGAVEELVACSETATEMGATVGVYHAATRTKPHYWPVERVMDAMVETADAVAARAPDGFTPVAENLKGPFLDAGDFETVLDRTDAALCLDTGHAHVSGYGAEWQADFLREHGERVRHIHLNDTRVERTNDEHLPVGVGDFDFETVADALRESEWSGTCTHEVFTDDLAPVPYGKENFDRLLA